MEILRTAINLRGKSVCKRNVYAILIPSKTTIFENTIKIEKNIHICYANAMHFNHASIKEKLFCFDMY